MKQLRSEKQSLERQMRSECISHIADAKYSSGMHNNASRMHHEAVHKSYMQKLDNTEDTTNPTAANRK